MSPVAPSSGHATRALTLTFAIVIVGMVVVWGASSLITKQHNSRASHGTIGGVVDLGSAKRLASQVDKGNGIPVYYPDVSGNSARSVYVSHIPGSATKGWSAFLAQVPGHAPSCLWEWNRATGRFDATCDKSLHADKHGAGLQHYPVTVKKGSVQVDLTVHATTTSNGK